MVSYASIDRIENGFVVMEVENLPKEESFPEDFDIKDTYMADVDINEFQYNLLVPVEGDIYSVEHDGQTVLGIIQEEVAEKQKRIAIINNYQ